MIFFQVFGLLMFEMSVFMALIVPLPFDWKRKLFEFISHSPIVAKLQYGMKVIFSHKTYLARSRLPSPADTDTVD